MRISDAQLAELASASQACVDKYESAWKAGHTWPPPQLEDALALDLRDARAALADYQKEYAKLEAQAQELNGDFTAAEAEIGKLHGLLIDASQMIQIARDALEVYAKHYPGLELRDGGDVARHALSKLK